MKKRVRPFAEKSKAKGINVEVFEPSLEAEKKFDDLKKQFPCGKVPEGKVYETQLFKENVMWRQKLRDEGYDILDIDGTKESTFYKMEKDPIWLKNNRK